MSSLINKKNYANLGGCHTGGEQILFIFLFSKEYLRIIAITKTNSVSLKEGIKATTDA